jgi:hypothetical protein
MPSRAYYLQQAETYFDMATMSRDMAMRDRWIDRANDYLILADALGDDPMPPSEPAGQPKND